MVMYQDIKVKDNVRNNNKQQLEFSTQYIQNLDFLSSKDFQ